MPQIRNRVLLVLSIAGGLAIGFAGFLDMAPNRLARGVDSAVWRLSIGASAAIAAPLVALFLLAFAARPFEARSGELNNPSSFETPHPKPRIALILRSVPLGTRLEGRGRPIDPRSIATLIAAAFLLYTCLTAAGLLAKHLASSALPALRLSLGAGFWIPFACALFAFLDALQRMKTASGLRAGLFALLCLPFALLAHFGFFDALSLTKEFKSHREAFMQALGNHLLLVGLSLIIALLIAIPIMLALRPRSRMQRIAYAGLGIIQAVPSIALFGLLIAPLSALVLHLPVLAQFGISGTGRTPAVIALVLYALLPLVRNGMTGLAAVPPDVKDAAMGLGFTARERMLKIDLPLALPALVSGLRVVTVQAIGLASVAALIGAGGLGTFVFQGIGQYALDLVLIGAIPIILLALGADLGFQLLLSAMRART